MIEIKPLAEEYRRCHGCMKSKEDTRLFELLFGTDNPSIQVILCEDCLKQLGFKIMDITAKSVTNEVNSKIADSYEYYHPAPSVDKQNFIIDFSDNPCDKAAIGLIEMFPNIKKSNPYFIEKCNDNYIVKYDVQGHDAYTLPAETGLFEDGWTINAEIQEDYYKWINDFEAVKSDGDKLYTVKGNFENEVICSSLEALEDFLNNHMPEEWDYWDI